MYATLVDMVARFGERDLELLADRGDENPNPDAIITQALDDATAEINGYLAGRYQLPLHTTPDALVRYCCDMARYHLSDDRAPEQIQKRYDAAIAFLTKVGKGQLSLGLADDKPTEQHGTVAVIQSDGHVFGRKSSKGFI